MRLHRSVGLSRRQWAVVGAAGAVLAAAAITGAHDEDWRKLRDLRPPVKGPIYRADEHRPASPGSTDGPFESHNVTLKSHLPLNAFGAGNSTSAADCWGYVSPSGREYAIVCLQRGYGFVEVTNPGNAQIVGHITAPSSLWHDVDVIGTYAYGGSEAGGGIQVMNMSQIDSGIVTLAGNVQTGGHTSSHTVLADRTNGFLYVCGSNLGGLVAMSVANPTQPAIVGQWNNGNYVHECQPHTYTSGPYAGKQIVFCFNGNDGLEIVDATNKANMVRIGGTTYSQLRYCHQGWLTPDEKYLYVNDELDEQNAGAATITRIINVENLSAPVVVGTFGNGLTSIDHNLYVRDNFIYQSNYSTGLRIWDAINPLAPVEVAHFDTHPEGNIVEFVGDWGNYPFFPSGTIILSDLERGMFVVKHEIGQLTFQFPSPLPTQVVPNTATPVTVKVVEDQITLLSGSVEMFTRVGSAPYTSVVMMPTVIPGEYTANLPGAPCLDTVNFYFSAEATDGRVFTSPNGAPGNAHAALSASGFTTLADLNFETDPQWAVVNSNLTTGAWERAIPHTPPSSNCPPADGDGSGRCWVTDNRSGNFDVDGGPTVLTTGTYDLSGTGAARLSYARWMSSTATDELIVQLSNNNGSTWTTIETVTSTGSWVVKEWDVGAILPLTAQMRVRFSIMDNPQPSLAEAGIDAFKLVSVQCANPCYADCDGDGQLTLADFGCYQTKFGLGDLYADCDGDGQLTLADFGCFQTKFGLGCP